MQNYQFIHSLLSLLVTLLRLADGPDATSGRVEVQRRGVWGTICDDDFDDVDADVICKQLGFSGGAARRSAYFGPGNGKIMLSGLHCSGDEPNVLACPRSRVLDSWCDHSEDASVICRQGMCRLPKSEVVHMCARTHTDARTNSHTHTSI